MCIQYAPSREAVQTEMRGGLRAKWERLAFDDADLSPEENVYVPVRGGSCLGGREIDPHNIFIFLKIVTSCSLLVKHV
jgi:hypothetical protein